MLACFQQALAPVSPRPIDPDKGCNDPPDFHVRAAVENVGSADNPYNYCVVYTSNNSVYPINCDMGGTHYGVMPGEQEHIGQGWYLNAGDPCSADVTCQKDVRLMKTANRWCKASLAALQPEGANKGCDDPPNFKARTAIENVGSDANPYNYCVAYVSNASAYPLNCDMGGYHAGVMPGENDHIIQGWYLNAGDTCSAHVTCQKNVSLMNTAKRWCQGSPTSSPVR
jgi:hypothetical protein